MNLFFLTPAAPRKSPIPTTEKRHPLGLGYLMAVLKLQGHKVHFQDEYLEESRILDSDFLARNRIDYVGIYANTLCYASRAGCSKPCSKSGNGKNGRERSWSEDPTPRSRNRPFRILSITSSSAKGKSQFRKSSLANGTNGSSSEKKPQIWIHCPGRPGRNSFNDPICGMTGASKEYPFIHCLQIHDPYLHLPHVPYRSMSGMTMQPGPKDHISEHGAA